MINLSQITAYLDDYLATENFSDHCVNGVQIEGTTSISKIVTGVSVSLRFIEEAIKTNSQMLIVHHGIFWKNSPYPFYLKGLTLQRVKLILENNLNLAAYHLPLDAHPSVGNNIQILNKLDIKTKKSFDIGYIGEYDTPKEIDVFKSKMAILFPSNMIHLNYGHQFIRTIAVVSGGASYLIEKAALSGADAFISGDIQEPVVRMAEELGLHYFAVGHYNSEKYGPMALAQHLNKTFSIPVDFIDVPNPA